VKRKTSRGCPPIFAETLNEGNIKARINLKRKLDSTVNTSRGAIGEDLKFNPRLYVHTRALIYRAVKRL
jgi:hypothetical protein